MTRTSILHDRPIIAKSTVVSLSNSNQAPVTAPTVPGYSFICWISSVSMGWIGFTSIGVPTSPSDNVYSDAVRTGDVLCTALYQRS
jgi:hypothetical protein